MVCTLLIVSVHYGDQQRTVRHMRGYCQCPDGKMCHEPDNPFRTFPDSRKRTVRLQEAKVARQQAHKEAKANRGGK